MARFSPRTGRWHGVSKGNAPLPETTRDEREWRTEMPGGMVRIDMGAPVPRLPGEPQPVAQRSPSKPARAPVVTPVADPLPPQRKAASVSPRQPWGLNRDGR